MNQVIRAGPRRWRRERARPESEQRDGAGGWETVRGAEQRPGPGGGRRKQLPRLSGGEEPAPRGPRAPGAAMVAGSRWRPRRVPASLERAGAEEVGREFLPVGSLGAWVRAPRGRDDYRKEDAGISFPAVRNRLLVSGSNRGLDSPPWDLQGPGTCGRGAASVSRAWSGVVPRPGSPWAAGSFVPAPRCPLFLPSAGRRGREKGGSGCPDVSALNDCVAGQSQPGVCGRQAPCLPALGVGALPAARGGRPGATGLFSHSGAIASFPFYKRNRRRGLLFFHFYTHLVKGCLVLSS